jgi:hypothetical protein
MGTLLVIVLALFVLAALAIFRKRRLKLSFKSFLATFSFEADDDFRPDV